MKHNQKHAHGLRPKLSCYSFGDGGSPRSLAIGFSCPKNAEYYDGLYIWH